MRPHEDTTPGYRPPKHEVDRAVEIAARGTTIDRVLAAEVRALRALLGESADETPISLVLRRLAARWRLPLGGAITMFIKQQCADELEAELNKLEAGDAG